MFPKAFSFKLVHFVFRILVHFVMVNFIFSEFWFTLCFQALVVCLESKDYTQIRNTIMVLTKVCVRRDFEKRACLFFFLR